MASFHRQARGLQLSIRLRLLASASLLLGAVAGVSLSLFESPAAWSPAQEPVVTASLVNAAGGRQSEEVDDACIRATTASDRCSLPDLLS